MVNYERGVYEPSDEVRVFDGSEEDEEDVEGSRLPSERFHVPLSTLNQKIKRLNIEIKKKVRE